MKKNHHYHVAIIGGGPAGLIAADVIAQAGFSVSLYDAMPSVGRKFLLAGVGGMNITHSEPHEKFLARYSDAEYFLKPFLDIFSAQHLRDWIHGLGIETFVGTSGRVFPADMKAAPLLRALLHRLRSLNVKIHPRHTFIDHTFVGNNVDSNEQPTIIFNTSVAGDIIQTEVNADVVLLALGGASWPRLGSNGNWVELLQKNNIVVNKLVPSNCGFEISWSQKIRNDFAGAQLNTIAITTVDSKGKSHSLRGEAIVSDYGIEGTTIYALSKILREQIYARGHATITLDLLPDVTREKIAALLAKPRGKNSMSNFLRKQLKLSSIKVALLYELVSREHVDNIPMLAAALKAIPVQLSAVRPIDEAISSAGGVDHSELTSGLMLKKLPNIFCAGEMLDWEAPTGGYLLSACFATGYCAAQNIVALLQQKMDAENGAA